MADEDTVSKAENEKNRGHWGHNLSTAKKKKWKKETQTKSLYGKKEKEEKVSIYGKKQKKKIQSKETYRGLVLLGIDLYSYFFPIWI